MKFIVIGDVHLGLSTVNCEKWLRVSIDYFDNFLAPQIKSLYEPGDIVLFMGDLFDNRTAVNIKAMNIALSWWDWFEANEITTYILIGNHDMYNETSKEYVSTNILKKYKDANIIGDYAKLTIDGVECAFMSYIQDIAVQRVVLNKLSPAKYLFCHTDLLGCRVRPTTKYDKGVLDKGPSISEFVQFDNIWSGHIHLNQDINNFKYVGCTYHQDHRDIGNQKGIYTLEPSTGKFEFIPNTVSPEFKTIYINNEQDLEITNSKGDWIEVSIKQSDTLNKAISKKLEHLRQSGCITGVDIVDNLKVENVVKPMTQNQKIDIKGALIKSVEDLQFDTKYKEKSKKFIDKIFKIHQEK